VSFALAAATILFSLADPRGDSLGDGGYTLPSRIESSALDLRTFSALNVNDKLEFRLTMDRVSNTENAPNGFSGPIFEIFLAESRGGDETLGPTGFLTPPSHGWQYRLSVNGFTARLITSPKRALVSGGNPAPSTTNLKVRVEGSDVVINTDLPARQYAYWAFVGVYDPLTPTGLKAPVSRWTPTQLASAIPNAPAAVDVLSKDSQVGLYASRVVPAVNEPVTRTSPLLLTGLAGLCIALGTTLWGVFRRR
jgi:C-terminal binding-module, SLH-like, of glucodextranase